MTSHLLSIVELGGYPNLAPVYRQAGFRVSQVATMRKALKQLKQDPPQVIVAEFNVQPDFRERTSNLESLLATVQGLPEKPRVLVLFEIQDQAQLDKLRERFDFFQPLAFPITPEVMAHALVSPSN